MTKNLEKSQNMHLTTGKVLKSRLKLLKTMESLHIRPLIHMILIRTFLRNLNYKFEHHKVYLIKLKMYNIIKIDFRVSL